MRTMRAELVGGPLDGEFHDVLVFETSDGRCTPRSVLFPNPARLPLCVELAPASPPMPSRPAIVVYDRPRRVPGGVLYSFAGYTA